MLMKKQILLVFAVMTAVCSYGQAWKMPAGEQAPKDMAPVQTVKKTITPTGNQFWWGYFSEDMASDLPYGGNLGWSSAATIDAAVYVQERHPLIGRGTLKALRFWLGDDISKISSDVTVWISSTLPNSAAEADYSQVIPRTDIVSRLNEVELTTPYRIGKTGFYVGFSLTTNGRSYPVMSYGDEDVPNSFFFRAGGQSWTDFPAQGYGYGILALQMLVDGVTLPDYNVSVSDFGQRYVLKGGIDFVMVKVKNEGKQPVTSLTYTITTDGNTTPEMTVTPGEESIPSFASGTILVSFESDAEASKHAKTVTITKVNGGDNISENNKANGSLITLSEKPAVVPVVEEFTGTWCGWCPFGTVGMAKAHETYGDKVVLIAAHNDDPMSIADYDPIMYQVDGFPSAFINRSIDVYPDVQGLTLGVETMMEKFTTGEIKATARWTDEDKVYIVVDTQTKFVYNDNNGDYGIAYVLIADGLKGTGSDWSQANYISGSNYGEDMEFWTNSGSYVSGLEFNHVAVGAWSILNGVDGSVNSNIIDGEIQDFSYTVSTAMKSVIQDKSKLKIAVLLIDRSTGCIVNGAMTDIAEPDPAAISDVRSTNTKEAVRYTLDGRQVSTSQRGLNIVKMSDGSVRKVVAK